jgi:zinc transport system permease protein
MVEMLSHGFMARAMCAGLIIGTLCALVSVFVALKRLSFIGAGISHSAFGGMALGALFGLDITISAAVYCVAVALVIGWLSRRGGVHEDVSIGVVFASSMALGVVALGLKPGYTVDLFSYLFGSILAVTWEDVALAAVALAAVAGVITVMFKELMAYCFDEEWARVRGINTRLVQDTLLILLALTVVVSIKLLGIILVSALMVTPGAIGQALAQNYRRQIAISIASAWISAIVGLALSYRFDIASGAAMALASAVLFAMAAAIPRRG